MWTVFWTFFDPPPSSPNVDQFTPTTWTIFGNFQPPPFLSTWFMDAALVSGDYLFCLRVRCRLCSATDAALRLKHLLPTYIPDALTFLWEKAVQYTIHINLHVLLHRNNCGIRWYTLQLHIIKKSTHRGGLYNFLGKPKLGNDLACLRFLHSSW